VPYLFLNATEVQSGRRFVVTPLFLQSQPSGRSRLALARLGPWAAAELGRGVSARFPIFSPAGYFFNNRSAKSR